jgi:propionate CoA-transferase
VLPIAQAARNCGGTVLAQVHHLLDRPAVPHQVRVPGVLVDRLVLAEPHEHHQTFAEPYNAAFCQPESADASPHPAPEPMPLDQRRVIAARASDELQAGDMVNLGIGMPEGIARIAAERGLLERITLSVESGPIGGMPAGGLSFGASRHPHAIIDQPAQFDFYDGRGLDFAALGAAQMDARGNVNVARFGKRFAGVGGFVNISQTAKRLVFCGTLTTGGLQVAVENGQLRILREGNIRKFVAQVDPVSFNADRSSASGQEVLYVTERAVFRLMEEGLELVEVAPGISAEEHVLPQMAFRPVIRNVRQMPASVFQPPRSAD